MENYDLFARILGIDPSTLPSLNEPPFAAQEARINCSALGHEDLSDVESQNLSSFLPAEPRKPDAISNRTLIDALLWCQNSGRALTELPERYGKSYDAIRKKAERWAIAGVWDHIASDLDGVDLSEWRRNELRRLSESYARRGDRIRRGRRKNWD